MKIYRLQEAAERLGFSPRILQVLEDEGRIKASERVKDIPYYAQSALDSLVQELHCSIQRATWHDMEMRMEEVEKRLEDLEVEQKKMRESTSRVL